MQKFKWKTFFIMPQIKTFLRRSSFQILATKQPIQELGVQRIQTSQFTYCVCHYTSIHIHTYIDVEVVIILHLVIIIGDGDRERSKGWIWSAKPATWSKETNTAALESESWSVQPSLSFPRNPFIHIFDRSSYWIRYSLPAKSTITTTHELPGSWTNTAGNLVEFCYFFSGKFGKIVSYSPFTWVSLCWPGFLFLELCRKLTVTITRDRDE